MDQPEVENMRLTLAIDEDVDRFEVAVNDAALVSVVNSLGYPRKEGEPVAERQSVLVAILHDRTSIHQLHDKVVLPVLGESGIVNGRNRGMPKATQSANLFLKSAEATAAAVGRQPNDF